MSWRLTWRNPRGPSAPSQFHHKYPGRASGAELIVQPGRSPAGSAASGWGRGPDRKGPRARPAASLRRLLPRRRGQTGAQWPGTGTRTWGPTCHLPGGDTEGRWSLQPGPDLSQWKGVLSLPWPSPRGAPHPAVYIPIVPAVAGSMVTVTGPGPTVGKRK